MNENNYEKSCPDVSRIRLGIEVTTECNIRCSHCFARSGLAEDANLSVDLVIEILSEGYETGYRNLHITGGEPLLWDGLWATLDKAFALGYETAFLNTNGTLLTMDIADKLSHYNGLTISVSLEGTESLHESLRGNGSYARVQAGIRNALHAGVDLTVFTVLCKSLLPDLPCFVDDLYKRYSDIEYLALIQLVGTQDNPFALADELLSPEDFLSIVSTVSLLNLYGLKTHVMNDPLVNVTSKMIEMPWIPQAYPLYCDGSMMIMASRDICLSHSTRRGFGKYEPGMIGRLLVSEPYRRAVSPDTVTCPSCDYLLLCREGGVYGPTESSRDLSPEPPYCKRVLDLISP